MVSMIAERNAALLCALAIAACSGDGGNDGGIGPGTTPSQIVSQGGNGQTGFTGDPLPDPLSVRVTDSNGDPVSGVSVSWSVLSGGGTVSPASTTTGFDGIATTEFTLGPPEGEQQAQAHAGGLAGSPVMFTAMATTSLLQLRVLSGGNNVTDRFSSDLWVHGNYAYTGTWGSRNGNVGNLLKVWSLDASGAPALVGSIATANIGTVSDVQVSDDGELLVFSGERGGDGGIYLYGLSDPANPSFLGEALVGSQGVHTVTLADLNGRRYAFAARNPGLEEPALLIFDVSDPAAPALVATEVVPRNYGIHDTFVRDGIAFVFAWNTGVIIYDVGNGIRGGAPDNPVEISRLVTDDNGVPGGPSVHNGWWFHNPVSGERRYLFIGQEGQAVIGSQATGDIHVVDISDLANPREVAFFRLNGAGTHNFWVDEQRQILYAAYYNGGVVALDVSGTLSGNLANRLLDQVRPGGAGNTYTWGVQLANGSLYAIDLLSGFWQLTTE